jgi:hypothetical protein
MVWAISATPIPAKTTMIKTPLTSCTSQVEANANDA